MSQRVLPYSLPGTQERVKRRTTLWVMAEELVKVTFTVTPTAKYRLASLKARLRREGTIETESGLVERLLSASSIAALEAELTRSKGRYKPK